MTVAIRNYTLSYFFLYNKDLKITTWQIHFVWMSGFEPLAFEIQTRPSTRLTIHPDKMNLQNKKKPTSSSRLLRNFYTTFRCYTKPTPIKLLGELLVDGLFTDETVAGLFVELVLLFVGVLVNFMIRSVFKFVFAIMLFILVTQKGEKMGDDRFSEST